MNQISVQCAECGCSLAVGYKEPCPKCGSPNRQTNVALQGAIEVDTALSVSWVKTREYYKKHKLLFPMALALTIGAPFIGLFLAGWSGVVISLPLSALCFWIGLRGITKVREIERGSG